MKIRALIAALLLAATTAHAEGKLVVYNWAEYIPEAYWKILKKKPGLKSSIPPMKITR